jgi:HEAT repeat protein
VPVPGAGTPAPSATPRPIGGPGPSTGVRKNRGTGAPGFEQWEFWWQYNKDALLNLKSHLFSGPVTGGYLGGAGREALTARPTAKVIEEHILPVLREALKHSKPDIRDSAMVGLGKVGGRPDLPALVEGLKDEIRSVREAAVLALGILGDQEATGTLIHVLQSSPEGRRLRGGKEPETPLRAMAALSLGLIGDERAIEALLAAVNGNEKAQDVPVSSAIGLGLMRNHDPKIVSTLIAVARDARRDQVVRAHAINSLGRIFQDRRGDAPREVVEAVGQALKDREGPVRWSGVLAVGLVARSEDPIARLLPQVFADDNDLTTRYWAGIAMGQIGGDAFRKTLEKGLGETGQARAYAALALGLLVRSAPRAGEANDATLGRTLEAFRDEKNPSTRGALAIAMGLMGGNDRSREALKQALVSSGDPLFQGYACVGLGLMRARDAKDTIVEVLHGASSKPDLQREAAIGLGLMGMRDVIPELVAVLAPPSGSPPSTLTMGSISQALGLIGDRTAIPPLVAIARNEDLPALSRGFALVALGNLGEEQPLPVLSQLSRDLNYRAMVEALQEVLDVL